jgi:hypothetical protein
MVGFVVFIQRCFTNSCYIYMITISVLDALTLLMRYSWGSSGTIGLGRREGNCENLSQFHFEYNPEYVLSLPQVRTVRITRI